MPALDFTPRPYQTMITDFILEHPRCNVWSFMGSGKTVATETALDRLYAWGIETRPTLILGPLRVARDVWPYETRKWSHLGGLEVVPIIGTEAERLAALRCDAPVYTINYDNLQWLCDGLKKWPFGTVVADESTRLKSHRLVRGGVRAQALSKIAFKTKRWINLTGTPSPNGLMDLWGQQWFIDEGHRLGSSYTAFLDRWFYKPVRGGPHAKPVPKEYAQEQIQQRLADCCLTIDAKDWFNIADPIVTDVYVNLPTDAMRHYKRMEREMFIELETASVEAFNSAAMTIKCLQLANGAIFTAKDKFEVVHDAKLEALDDIIEEWNGTPLIVAYHFRHDLQRLKARYPQARELKTKRDEDDWNAGNTPLLLLHPESAGHGLNLQDGGNVLVFFGHWWALEAYQQIIERIGPVRQMQSGHQRGVFVYHILARRTLDDEVMARRRTKAEVQDLLLAAMKKAT